MRRAPTSRQQPLARTLPFGDDEALANGGPFPVSPGPPLHELGFDGYRRFHLPAGELEDYDGRIEFWDDATETALQVREPNSPIHEFPSQRLAALGERIAQVRGHPILCFGTMNLALPGKDGRPGRMMQADQSLYLQPQHANLVGPKAMTVGENHYPDIVLEVDYTTDIRRHKLKLYEAWGFPEVWVDVPDESTRSGDVHGTTIYVLREGKFQVWPESLALPGWVAEDIHRALNEKQLSDATVADLQRIGGTLGARDGTGPDDDPLQRSLRAAARVQGHEEGRKEALAEAHASQLERCAAMVRDLMLLRDLDVAENFPLDEPDFATANMADVADAAASCDDEADFVARLRAAQQRRG